MALVVSDFDPYETGNVTYENYKNAVLENPALLEAFGQIYPDRMAVQAFLTTFTTNVTTSPLKKKAVKLSGEELAKERRRMIKLLRAKLKFEREREESKTKGPTKDEVIEKKQRKAKRKRKKKIGKEEMDEEEEELEEEESWDDYDLDLDKLTDLELGALTLLGKRAFLRRRRICTREQVEEEECEEDANLTLHEAELLRLYDAIGVTDSEEDVFDLDEYEEELEEEHLEEEEIGEEASISLDRLSGIMSRVHKALGDEYYDDEDEEEEEPEEDDEYERNRILASEVTKDLIDTLNFIDGILLGQGVTEEELKEYYVYL